MTDMYRNWQPTAQTSDTPGIFISYRRGDSAGHAGRLYDDLAEHFGADRVFRDIDDLQRQLGLDWAEALEHAIASCDVVIALIGPDWVSADARRRLENPNDILRQELTRALERPGTRVIPVLVGGAAMPPEEALPKPLRPLRRRQAIELSDARWRYDVGQLIAALDPLVTAPRQARRVASAPARQQQVASRPSEPAPRVSPQHRKSGCGSVLTVLVLLALVAGVVGALYVLKLPPFEGDTTPTPTGNRSAEVRDVEVLPPSDDGDTTMPPAEVRSAEVRDVEVRWASEWTLRDAGAENMVVLQRGDIDTPDFKQATYAIEDMDPNATLNQMVDSSVGLMEGLGTNPWVLGMDVLDNETLWQAYILEKGGEPVIFLAAARQTQPDAVEISTLAGPFAGLEGTLEEAQAEITLNGEPRFLDGFEPPTVRELIEGGPEVPELVEVFALDSMWFDPPVIEAAPGQEIHVVNAGDLEHSFVVEGLPLETQVLGGHQEEWIVVPDDAPVGESFVFFCGVDDHRAAGMEGTITIVDPFR